MDIFANWHKGKKEHDEKVFDHEAAVLHIKEMQDQIKRRMHIEKAYLLLNPIRNWCDKEDRALEAKHWQILSEYAADQVKELMKPERPEFVTKTTIDGSVSKTIIERAEKRHGFGINNERIP